MRDVSEFSLEELRAFIANYERLGRTKEPYYDQLLAELQARETKELDLDRSMKAIMGAARERRYISYGEVARANGLDWSYALNRQMPKHLDLIIAKSHAKGLPLITAIVVNQNHLDSGNLEAASLRGFISGAKRLGYVVQDDERFLRDHQNRTFELATDGGAA